jgi:TetR/AcrR family transcriptional regulator
MEIIMGISEKHLAIIDAAILRFKHFGIAKTTMNDIAADLSMSKASLYYYFPDKNHLCAAALDHLIDQTFLQIRPELAAMTDCMEAVHIVLSRRIEFVQNYYNLLEYTVGTQNQVPKEVASIFQKARSVQMQLMADILHKGIENQQLSNMHVEEHAHILLFAIEGIRINKLKDKGTLQFPDEEDFNEILRLQETMVRTYFRGLAV